MDQSGSGTPWLPPGFRFHPTDDELVSYYLTHKIQNPAFTDRAFAEADLNKCEPWDLPAIANSFCKTEDWSNILYKYHRWTERAKMGEKEWYFYSLRDRKYPTGMRTNRATNAGYWKATGKDREVINPRTSCLVGMKKTLVFYLGRAPKGEKTNWVMHEYRLEGNNQIFHHLHKTTKDEWVVCRIFQKSIGGRKTPFINSKRSYIDDVPSALPPLLDSPHVPSSSTHEDASLQERYIGCMPFKSIAAFNQAANYQATSLDYGGVLSDVTSLTKCSPYVPAMQYEKSQITPTICFMQENQDNIPSSVSFFQHACLPTAPSSSTIASVTSSMAASLPFNAILKALADQYTNTSDADMKYACKTEPYLVSVQNKLQSKVSPEDGFLLAGNGHLPYGTLVSQQQQQQATQNIQATRDDCESHTQLSVSNRLSLYPSDPPSCVDPESFWAY